MSQRNLQVTLAKRPVGWVKETDFTVVESAVPRIGTGEVLVRNHWLSLDPYMRGRMDDGPSYAAPAALGAVMVGGTVGEVVESNNAKFSVGDQVVSYLGWQQFAASTGVGLTNIDTRVIPASAYLGAVGMPGVTAWLGMSQIAEPKPGETVVVSAASGPSVRSSAKWRSSRAVAPSVLRVEPKSACACRKSIPDIVMM